MNHAYFLDVDDNRQKSGSGVSQAAEIRTNINVELILAGWILRFRRSPNGYILLRKMIVFLNNFSPDDNFVLFMRKQKGE
uniref:Uncharacterized protein n=1 Tax=Meloidogyne enterolobii TaxID=390850 RepID=A0A6V7UG03_MELEN|nr:unnamed protein product [Meloidogyne enterolobii]